MAGIHNEIVYGQNMDFRGVWPPIGQITQNGQIFIGGVISPFMGAGFITSLDSSITWTFGQNTIDASVSASGLFPWTDTSGSFTAAVNHGYFLTAASTPLLPASPTQGQRVGFIADTTGSVVVTANTGQSIRIANQISSVAGTATNALQGDALILVYRASVSTWFSEGSPAGAWLTA